MFSLDDNYSEDFDESDNPEKPKSGHSTDSNGEKIKTRESSPSVRFILQFKVYPKWSYNAAEEAACIINDEIHRYIFGLKIATCC